MLTVLGMDPGTTNCAASVIQMKDNLDYRVVWHGMIEHPVKEMNGLDVGTRMEAFTSEVRKLKRVHKCNFAIAERFMTRGHGGTTIEAVSTMLGLLGALFKRNVAFISASTWKNQFNRCFSLDDFYEDLKPYGIPTHRIDAVSIGIYGASLILQDKPDFKMLRNAKSFKKKILDAR